MITALYSHSNENLSSRWYTEWMLTSPHFCEHVGKLGKYWQGVLSTLVHLLSSVWLFMIPWTAAHQAFLSFTVFWSLLRFMSIELMMPSNHRILCRPLLLLSSVFPGIKVFLMSRLFASGGQSERSKTRMESLQYWTWEYFLERRHLLYSGGFEPLRPKERVQSQARAWISALSPWKGWNGYLICT